MGLTIAWGCCRAMMTVGLAVVLVGKATTEFEAAAFLAALIAYHRLGWMMSSEALASLKRAIRVELWLHRIDQLVRGPEVAANLSPLLRHIELDPDHRLYPGEALEDLTKEVELVERKNRVNHIIWAVVEVALIAGLLLVLLE